MHFLWTFFPVFHLLLVASGTASLAASSSASDDSPWDRRLGSEGFLKRTMFTNASVVCNDGTRAGYYIRPTPEGSRRWIIFLEGGWYCFNAISCHHRWYRMKNFMTSAHWAGIRSVGGILSPIREENPFWWNANHVLVPYCSSDTWSGRSFSKGQGDLSFLGSLIVEQVFRELIPRGILDAKVVILAGSSAGAAGVLVNIDRIAALLKSHGSTAQVQGLVDSGWFLDNEPFDQQEQQQHNSSPKSSSSYSDHVPTTTARRASCTDAHSCPPVESIKQGIRLWAGQVPERCRTAHPQEPWRCYFGHVIYETLASPVFVYQWLYDEAQMTVDNIAIAAAPFSKDQWNYVHRMGQKLRTTFVNVSVVFAPSCISHIVLTKREWTQIEVNGVSLPHALKCWELSIGANPQDSSSAASSAENPFMPRDSPTLLSSDFFLAAAHKLRNRSTDGSNRSSSSTAVVAARSKKKKKKRTSRRRNHQASPVSGSQANTTSTTTPVATGSEAATTTTSTLTSGSSGSHRRKRRSHIKFKPELCRRSYVDSCSWPQCNKSCPRLLNPTNGEEVTFLQLLKSFGLEMNAIAAALGVEERALREMDQDQLLHLLTHYS